MISIKSGRAGGFKIFDSFKSFFHHHSTNRFVMLKMNCFDLDIKNLM